MACIRLEWAQFGDFDSFDVIRSTTSMVGIADVDLPTPIATGLNTMYYVDSNVIEGLTYYYKVCVWRGTASFLSVELKAIATVDLMPEMNVGIQPYAFWKLNDLEGDFIDSSGNNKTLVASPTALMGLLSVDPTGQVCSGVNPDDNASATRMIGTYNDTSDASYDFTVCMWLHMPDISVETSGEFFKLDLRDGKGFSIGFGAGDENSPPTNGRWINVGQNSISFRNTGVIFPNHSHNAHLAVCWNSGYLKCFLNGELKSDRYVGNYEAAQRSIYVGRGEGDFRSSFGIKMSRIAVYDGALTDQDIMKIATSSPVQR